jgi:Tfp pilus assembly protein FimT
MIEKHKLFRMKHNATKGFSTIELVMSMLVVLIVAAIGVPQFMTMIHVARTKGAVSDFAGLLQAQRLRAVDDDRFYSTYVLAAGGNNPQEAFVDIYPQNVNGTSGTGGATYTCVAGTGCDPVVLISQEINQQRQANAPNTAALKLLMLPANSPVAPIDGSLAASPITFGPRGLPCTPQPVAGGTVCSLAVATAYWTFFQNNVTQSWGAVTVSPAGRVRRWYYSPGAAGAGNWISY